MSLKDQTPTHFLLRTVDTDHDRGVRVLFGELGAAGMPLDCSPIHAEAIQRQTFVPEGTKHEILNRVLCAANRGASLRARKKAGQHRGGGRGARALRYLALC